MRVAGVALALLMTGAVGVFAEPRLVEAEGDDAAVAARDRADAADRAAKDREQAARDRDRAAATAAEDQQQAAYDKGTAALDAGRWAQAFEIFDRLAKSGGKKADAALYWTAYAQNKMAQAAAALAAIRTLQKDYPQSPWIKDAKALEIEMGRGAGRTPQVDQPDDEMKLLALDSLMNGDPERALPLLEKFLTSSSSPKLRERALFVLAQSGSPKAREILLRTAKGEANPEMQRKAIEYIGLFGGTEGRQVLESLYASATDVETRKTILHSYLVTGDKTRLLTAARTEKNEDLRREAIHTLGAMGAQSELWELYKTETSQDAKKAIIQSLFIGGGADRLTELTRTEKDPELRREAIRSLGLIGKERTGATLIALYASEPDVEARRAVLQALFVQGNAEALVDIARKEKDPQLRRDAVTQLSHMNSKASTDFMLEILNK